MDLKGQIERNFHLLDQCEFMKHRRADFIEGWKKNNVDNVIETGLE